MSFLTTDYTTKNIVLERLKRAASSSFNGLALDSLTLNSYQDLVMDRLVYIVEHELPAEELENRSKTLNISYPSTWWQMFKEQYFPIWLKERFPIEMKRVSKKYTFRKLATYPKLPLVFPEAGPIVYRSYMQEK